MLTISKFEITKGHKKGGMFDAKEVDVGVSY